MQPCRVCGCIKPLDAFEFRKDSGKHRTDCKPCRSTASVAQRYGITLGELEDLKQKQGNSCAACGIHADEIDHDSFKHNPLVLDHDHVTHKVRGLLCPNCNLILGHSHDSVKTLLQVVTYLESFNKGE